MKLKSVADRFSAGLRYLLVCHLYYIAVLAAYFTLLWSLDTLGIYVVQDGGFPGILFLIMLIAPGIVGQLFYVIPSGIHFTRAQKQKALWGLLAGAFITGAVNVGAIFVAIGIGISTVPDAAQVNPFLKFKNSRPMASQPQPEKSTDPSRSGEGAAPR